MIYVELIMQSLILMAKEFEHEKFELTKKTTKTLNLRQETSAV
jgi:hypothetical protein